MKSYIDEQTITWGVLTSVGYYTYGSFHEVESIQKLCVLPGHYMQPIKKQMWPCVFVSMNLKIEYYPTV